MLRRRSVPAVALALVLAAAGGGPAACGGSGDAPPRPARVDVTAVMDGIPQDGLVLGDPRAPVLLVEFADPQCPFCRQFAARTLPALVRRYVRTGKVRLELRLVGFLGPDSVRGDRALVAAALQDRLWQAAVRFYALQGRENSGYVTDAFLRRVLGGVRGLDAASAMAARDSPAVLEELGAVSTMQSRYGVHATPTLLIGRDDADLRLLSEQASTPEQVGAAIDAELARVT
jgi:protein-disulfide isomerase